MEKDDLYTTVRGVKIPTVQIQQVEQEFGVQLVPDTEGQTLRALDLLLQRHRLEHDNRDPDIVILREQPEWLYKHMVLNIQFMGMSIPGPYNKPCWFRFKRNFNNNYS